MQQYLESSWDADEHGSFRCPIPGHADTALLLAQDGDLRLGCNCMGRWRSLGEVRAAIAYGHDRDCRTNIEIATWTRRLAYEAGVFAPMAVAVPELADTALAHVIRARDGFALLIGLRWADGQHRAVAFAIRFCSAWTGMSHSHAHDAITALIAKRVMVKTGCVGRVPLYLPGDFTAATTADLNLPATPEPTVGDTTPNGDCPGPAGHPRYGSAQKRSHELGGDR